MIRILIFYPSRIQGQEGTESRIRICNIGIPHVFVSWLIVLDQCFFVGVKVRRLNEDGESVPVYPTTISLLAEYDPKVESIL
jgi:hypothetical protein